MNEHEQEVGALWADARSKSARRLLLLGATFIVVGTFAAVMMYLDVAPHARPSDGGFYLPRHVLFVLSAPFFGLILIAAAFLLRRSKPDGPDAALEAMAAMDRKAAGDD